MKHVHVLLILLLFSLMGFTQTGIVNTGMTHCDDKVNAFLNQFDIPAATFAISKDGKLVYMRSFGHADMAETEATQPYHMFRIASVSKPITGIAMMKMLEDGQISLDDKVFGANGIFANNDYFNNANIIDNRIYDITVRHLLEHSGGWDRDVPCVTGVATPYAWTLAHCDPIGFPLHVTHTLGEDNPVSERALIKFLLEKGLNFDPGTQYKYSNIGYLTLGLIIEEITGKSYEQYVKDEILNPVGICDMHIGKNLLANKREREGEYEGNGYTAPSIYGTNQNVPWEYGGWNLEAMDAHGGWIATARDLVRLTLAVDGFNTKPDILSASSIQTMVEPSANASYYAKGWTVNNANNWWHTGALDGTASILVRTGSGFTWALILNKRIIDNNSNAFWTGFDNLPWQCVTQTSSFPTWDLLDVPSQNSSALSFTSEGSTSSRISWVNGSGDGRVLIAREGVRVDEFPLDGVDYHANADFGQGDDVGNGNFVVYNGSGNELVLTGLDATKTYHFRLFEYNKNTNTGNHTLYQLCDAAVDSATTETNTAIADLEKLGIRFFPNPAHHIMQIELAYATQVDYLELRNMQGQIVRRMSISDVRANLNVGELAPQIYMISFFKKGNWLGSARVVVQ